MRSVLIMVICYSACTQIERVDKVKSIPLINVVQPPRQTNYNDPIFFMSTGTSFPVYWQSLYKLGRFNEMLKWMSKKSRIKYSDKKLVAYFSEMQFAYPLKLKSTTKEGDTIVMNYMTAIFGTKSIRRISTVIENDSCRILLENLNKNPF